MADLRLSLISSAGRNVSSARDSNIETASLPDKAPTTLRDFITSNPDYYHHACISGIVLPNSAENNQNSLTKYNLRYRIWTIYLHLTLAISTVSIIVVGILVLAYTSRTKSQKATLFCETIGIVIQNAVLYPAVVYLRQNLVSERTIDLELYDSAFRGSMIIGQRVRWFSMASLVAYSVLVVGSMFNDTSAYSVLSIIAYFVFLTPTQFFLSGILTFLIMEQRISLQAVRTIINAVDKQSLSRACYFEVRDVINQRDRHAPINILISCAIINFILSLILIFTKESHISTGRLCLYIFYVAVIFGKEFLVLVLLLIEIVEVNEKCEHFVKSIAKCEWTANDGVGEDAKERQRLSLYAAVKEFPVGSSIFWVRPKKFEVTVQLLSMVLSALAAVFWAFAL